MPRLDNANITAIKFDEGAAPSTPAAADWKIYFKSDGLYVINSAGTEFGPIQTGINNGRIALYIPASDMAPSATGGCAALANVATGANAPDVRSLDFDTATQEYAQFSIRMPKGWNEGTVTFSPAWSHAATTVNFGVVWSLQGVAVSDDDTMNSAYGTIQTSTDTGGTTNDLYHGPESSAITIAGTPAAEDTVFFRVSREVANGSDNMAIDARLHGITLYITRATGNDL